MKTKLHELIKRQYDIIKKPFLELEVLSDNTWEPIEYIGISKHKKTIKMSIEDNICLICTPDHILIDENENEFFAKNGIGKTIFVLEDKNIVKKRIIAVEEHSDNDIVYDLSLGKDKHTYFTNGVLSHNCLVLDEFAFLPKHIADKLFTSIYPVISSSPEGKIIIVSTPNGTAGNLYYDLWQQANSKSKNEEGWKPFEMHWWDVPGRDEKFKETTIASIGQKRWDQEFACEFLSPSDFRKLIPEDILEKHKMRLDQYKLKDEAKGREMQIISQDETKVFNFTMWECFSESKTYLASGDVAEGTGNDSSVLYVWDVTDLSKIELVCKFAENDVSILEFAYVAKQILQLYANPPLIAENNSIGSGFLDVLRLTHEYPNIVQEGGKNNPWGVRAQSVTKSKACIWTRDMFTTQGFDWILKDPDLLKEIGTFVKKEGSVSVFSSYSAMGNAHDDLVMSLVWCAYLLQPEIVEKYFIAAEYFTSSLGVTYPKILKPGLDYTELELKTAYESPYYKEFQETVAERRKQKKESDETKKALAAKERSIKALERRISETDYSRQILDPFNPMQNRTMEQKQVIGTAVPGFIVGDESSRFGESWSDSDFEGETWSRGW